MRVEFNALSRAEILSLTPHQYVDACEGVIKYFTRREMSFNRYASYVDVFQEAAVAVLYARKLWSEERSTRYDFKYHLMRTVQRHFWVLRNARENKVQWKLRYFEDLKRVREPTYSPFANTEPNLRGHLERALNALDERDRTILTNKYLYDADHQDLSAELGVSHQRISQLNEVALKRMRKLVLKRKSGGLYGEF